jgi:quercetin dioxygenase-like cupin family protein
MEIKRSGSQSSTRGPADWFTGNVRIDPLFKAAEPAHVRGASVTFEPGARNGVAYASARSNVNRYFRRGLGAARGRLN